jgi:DNA-directed RNA polymerase specialized sigma24 family protein
MNLGSDGESGRRSGPEYEEVALRALIRALVERGARRFDRRKVKRFNDEFLDDLANEVYVKVSVGPARWREPGYITAVVSNALCDDWNAEKKCAPQCDTGCIDPFYEKIEENYNIEQLMRRVSNEERRVLTLIAEGKSAQEIQADLGITNTRYYTVREHLQKSGRFLVR